MTNLVKVYNTIEEKYINNNFNPLPFWKIFGLDNLNTSNTIVWCERTFATSDPDKGNYTHVIALPMDDTTTINEKILNEKWDEWQGKHIFTIE